MSDEPAPSARRRLRRPTVAVVGGLAVMGVFGMAGLLFAVSASTARGTQLRADRTDLAALIRSENAQRVAAEQRLADLRAQVDGLTATAARGDSQVAALRRRAQEVSPSAGLTQIWSNRRPLLTFDQSGER